MGSKNGAIAQKLKQIIAIANDCLVDISGIQAIKNKHTPNLHVMKSQQIQYSMSASAFMKKYSTKAMSGPKKFVLLVAYLSKGDINQNVELSIVEKAWGKMNRLIKKKYNRSDSVVARDNGWVDTRKYGQYHLCDTWQEIFA